MIKYIGQHIFDFIARFRNDIYLENIADGTVDSDKFLGLDSSGKVVKETVTSSSGDITGVDLTGGTGIEIASETNTTSGDYSATINCDLEGTELKSTGETGTAKFLRVDGDGTCSWQVPSYIADTQLSTEAVQDIVGGMFSSNTETLCTVTYEDGDGTIDVVVDNDLSNYDNSSSGFITSTLTTEQVQDIVGGMFSGNTETRISATYQDGDGTIDLAVDDMTANDNTTYGISCVDGDNSDEEKIRLTGSDSSTDDIVLEAGTGLSIARSSDKITFTNTVSNTDTTYTAGTGLDLSGGNEFSVDVSDFMTNGSNDRIVTATGTDGMNAESNLTFNGSTLTVSGNVRAASISHAISGNNAGDYGPGAEILTGIGSDSVTAGVIYCLRPSSGWVAIDADVEANINGLIAVATSAAGSGDSSDGMIIKGCVTLASAYTAGSDDLGQIVYGSLTAGEATLTAPTASGDYVRILGYSLNVSSKKMFFNPDSTYIELT